MYLYADSILSNGCLITKNVNRFLLFWNILFFSCLLSEIESYLLKVKQKTNMYSFWNITFYYMPCCCLRFRILRTKHISKHCSSFTSIIALSIMSFIFILLSLKICTYSTGPTDTCTYSTLPFVSFWFL